MLFAAVLWSAVAACDTSTSAIGNTSPAGDVGLATSDSGSPPTPCAGAALCEDFESTAVGAVPGGAWSVMTPSCSGTGRVAVTADQAHSGSHSLAVLGGSFYCDHVFLGAALPAGIGTTIHVRFHVRLAAALGDNHTTFLAMRDSSHQKDLRMGGQSKILMWNRELDDATLPVLSPVGIGLSVVPPVNQWICVEAALDTAAGTLTTRVNGSIVTGLVADATPTPDVDTQWLNGAPWRPTLVDLRIGWESYAGQALTLWFDDVAVAATALACP